MDQSEHGRIRNLLSDRCPNEPIDAIVKQDTSSPSNPPTTTQPPDTNCDPSYPDVCIPPPPPDLNCGDIAFRNFRVLVPDPQDFDGNNDGIGCTS